MKLVFPAVVSFRVRAVVAIFVAIAALLTYDVRLFMLGKSWTWFQYESMLPLLLLGQRRFVYSKVIFFVSLITVTKVLFYEFGLTFQLILESCLATSAMVITAIGLLIFSMKEAFQSRVVTALGLLLLLLSGVADKTFAGDKLFASYVLPQMKIGQKPFPAKNTLQKEIIASVKNNGTILIVWEALGWPKDTEAINRFKVLVPTAAVQRVEHEGGSTLTAEMRYLCGSNAGVLNYADCAPHYAPEAIAMHGNALSYFQRQREYPAMGFKRYLGRQELLGLSNCQYAYNAVCDDALFDRLIQMATLARCRGLFYAMSIDSHFPYQKYKDHVAGLLADVKSAVKKLQVIKNAIPECNIVIIGDHPPPLSTQFDPHAIMRIDIR